MRPDRGLYDLDAMIVNGEIEGDKVSAQKRLDIAARDRGFEFALLHDVEMMIEIAKASSTAAEKDELRREEERDALASADPVESERMRRLVGARRRRRAAVLAMSARSAL